jgi:hypothetical protein
MVLRRNDGVSVGEDARVRDAVLVFEADRCRTAVEQDAGRTVDVIAVESRFLSE